MGRSFKRKNVDKRLEWNTCFWRNSEVKVSHGDFAVTILAHTCCDIVQLLYRTSQLYVFNLFRSADRLFTVTHSSPSFLKIPGNSANKTTQKNPKNNFWVKCSSEQLFVLMTWSHSSLAHQKPSMKERTWHLEILCCHGKKDLLSPSNSAYLFCRISELQTGFPLWRKNTKYKQK